MKRENIEMPTDALYPFQYEAMDKATMGRVYLGFDPGLGKSRTALEIAQAKNAKRILVICHASGRYVWEREVKKWTNYQVTIVRSVSDLRGSGVLVLTYGLVSQSGSPYAAAVAMGSKYDVTILDEASALKNAGANRTKMIFGKMLPQLGYVVPLSGTPAPNHAGELFPVLKALFPKALIKNNGTYMSQFEFEECFCKVVQKRFGNSTPVRVIEGSKNLGALKERLKPFMLRVRKEDVLKDLPPVRYDIVPVAVDLDMARDLPDLSEFADDEALHAYFSGHVGDRHIMRIRQQLGVCKTGPSVEYIDDFVTNLPPKKKVLVFAHHRSAIEHLMVGLADWSPVSIVGDTTEKERASAITKFLGDPRTRIFVGNIQAAGLGLTLVGPDCDCSDVFFVEASYSVGDNVQAAARVHRIGQSEAVVARFLTAHGTIDDRIQSILARKANDFATLFN
jgi:SWI/SNF-related matrix-associated actin-dependent regulator 1 of chromatin subfamily A